MKTPIKSLLLTTFVASFGLTTHAQLPPGYFLPTNAFVAPSAGNLALRDTHLGVGASLFGENLYLNSTLGVNNIFSSWFNGNLDVSGNFDPLGGQIRVIYLGKTAGWENDLGYVLKPPAVPSAYTALATGIDGTNPISGYESIVSYGAGQTVDFFVNSGGPSDQGGLFFALGTANQFSGADAFLHIHWNAALLPTDEYGSLWTYFIGYEDTRQVAGPDFADTDFNDLMIAIQFLPNEAVPEPSTYGLIGAVGLLGLAGYKRFKAKKQAAQTT